jgi:hypothetical protein
VDLYAQAQALNRELQGRNCGPCNDLRQSIECLQIEYPGLEMERGRGSRKELCLCSKSGLRMLEQSADSEYFRSGIEPPQHIAVHNEAQPPQLFAGGAAISTNCEFCKACSTLAPTFRTSLTLES